MTGQSTEVELLSREEMDALLEGAVANRRKEPAAPLLRERRRSRRHAGRFPLLHQAVVGFAADWSRQLSSTHQRRIECSLVDWDEGREGLEDLVLPTDRASLFEVLPVGAQGFILPSRTLVFALLSLEFGARAADARIVPTRHYTAIEQRFQRVLSRSVLEGLEARWSEWARAKARPIGCAEPGELPETLAQRLVVASLAIRGLGLVAGLRVGFPASCLGADRHLAEAAPALGAPEVEERLRDLALTLRARVGVAQITISRLGSLRSGDVLRLEPVAANGLLVDVEGRAKFRAVRGAVGQRLAVQIEERL